MGDRHSLYDILSTFIDANHILAHHGIVDGFGHVSVRNPHNPTNFFTSVGIPPALVTSLEHIGEYTVDGAVPIIDGVYDPSHKQSPYSERFIHASLLARFPFINAVVHSHSPSVVSFSVCSVPLKPVWHMAGFLYADGVEVWDIDNAYKDIDNAHKDIDNAGRRKPEQKHHLLVNNQHLGDHLAAAFSGAPDPRELREFHAFKLLHEVVLQRGHGFAAVGKSLQEVVYRAIYTQENAKVQRDALNASKGNEDAIHYLSWEEANDCRKMADGAVSKAWPLWVKEVRLGAMFQNELHEKMKKEEY